MANGWENVGAKEREGGKSEVKYLKFPVGTSIIRILDEAPVSSWTHWIGSANKGKGVSVNCIGKDCPICKVIKAEKALKSKTKTYTAKMTHSINVLVKQLGTEQNINEVMVLEGGNAIFGQIKDQMTMLQTMGLSTDLRNIDLVVQRTGTGFNDTKYSVMANAMSAKPLTDAEKELPLYNLEEIKPALNAEQILDLMDGKSLDEVIVKDEVQEETPEPVIGEMPF